MEVPREWRSWSPQAHPSAPNKSDATRAEVSSLTRKRTTSNGATQRTTCAATRATAPRRNAGTTRVTSSSRGTMGASPWRWARRRHRADDATTTMAPWRRIPTGPRTTRPRPRGNARQIGAVQNTSATPFWDRLILIGPLELGCNPCRLWSNLSAAAQNR